MESKLSLQHETRPYVSGFPLGCFDHSSLMERDPKTTVAISFLDPTKKKFCFFK